MEINYNKYKKVAQTAGIFCLGGVILLLMNDEKVKTFFKEKNKKRFI